jgi:hypothetical protein
MDKALADLLVTEGGMSPSDVTDCAALAKDSGQTLDRLLVSKGYLNEPQMLKLMARWLAYPFRPDLRDIDVPKHFVDRTSRGPSTSSASRRSTGRCRSRPARPSTCTRSTTWPR